MSDLKSLCVSSLWRCTGRTLVGEEEKEEEGEPRRRRTVTGQEGAEAGTQSSVSNSSAGRWTKVEGHLKKGWLKKCYRSRQWGSRSPVCRCPPLQHQHGAGEHRSQHGAAESSGRWGWRWRGWQLLPALTASLCSGGMMRSIRADYSLCVSSQPVKRVFREEDITHEFAPVWGRQTRVTNSI